MIIRWRNREIYIYIYACEDARKKPEKHNERKENECFFDTGSITIFITIIGVAVLVTIAHNLVSRLDNIPELVTFFVHERSFFFFFCIFTLEKLRFFPSLFIYTIVLDSIVA